MQMEALSQQRGFCMWIHNQSFSWKDTDHTEKVWSFYSKSSMITYIFWSFECGFIASPSAYLSLQLMFPTPDSLVKMLHGAAQLHMYFRRLWAEGNNAHIATCSLHSLTAVSFFPQLRSPYKNKSGQVMLPGCQYNLKLWCIWLFLKKSIYSTER